MFDRLIDPKNTEQYLQLEEKYNKLTKDFIKEKKESKELENRLDILEKENKALIKENIELNNQIKSLSKNNNENISSKEKNDFNDFLKIFLNAVNDVIKNHKILDCPNLKYIFILSKDFREALKIEEENQEAYLRVFRELNLIEGSKNRFTTTIKLKGSTKRVFAINRKKVKLIVQLLEDD